MASFRVLLIDADDEQREFMRVALGLHGIRMVSEAKDSASGVTMAKEVNPHVIVMDQDLPDMTGIEALPLIQESCPEARIVMWSSAVDDAGMQARLAGTIEYHEKHTVCPFYMGGVVLRLGLLAQGAASRAQIAMMQ